MKLPQYAIALLITGFMSAIFSGQANAKNGELSMPKELVGIWGDDEMCIAYHRNDLYYIKRFNDQADSDIASLKINLALFAGDWEKFPELLNIEKQEAQNRNPIHLLQTAPILADYDLDEAMNFLKLYPRP